MKFARFFGTGDKTIVQGNVPTEVLEQDTDRSREEIIQIPISNIRPNRFQPRTMFDEDKLDELAQTIESHGIIQPIVVRKLGANDYEIIAGERRFRAMRKLGWEKAPTIVKDLDDKETASIALIENLQREELSPIEEALAYQRLLEIHQLTQEALAQRLGKGQSTVANKLRLLKLPEKVQHALLSKEITERHARALLPLKDEEKQYQILEEIIEKGLNVKQTEDRVEKMQSPKKEKKPRRLSVSRDIRIAFNTIRQSIDMVKKSGVNVDSYEEEDLGEFYQVVIRIPKKKS